MMFLSLRKAMICLVSLTTALEVWLGWRAPAPPEPIRCASCYGDIHYPLLLTYQGNKRLCASDFHQEWIDFAFHPTFCKLISRKLSRW